MKTRESGMPDEAMWQGFFRPEEVLRRLLLTRECGMVKRTWDRGQSTYIVEAT